MKKTPFSERHKISEAKPTDLKIQRITLLDFSETIEDFMERNFKGAARVRMHINTDKASYMTVSAEYVAYFLKLLLTYIYGRVFLNITMECVQNELQIKIDADEELPLDRRDIADIIKTARAARFSITTVKNGFLLTKEVYMPFIYSIHAITADVFRAKLYEIFFSGYVPDDSIADQE